MRWIVLKSDRGPKLGEYILFAVLDSKEGRDEYFPGKGQASETFDNKWEEIGGPQVLSQF